MVAAQGVAHLPLMERHDAIGKAGRQRQIVGHPEDAAALIGQFTQLAEQLAGQPFIEPGGDLVRQNVASAARAAVQARMRLAMPPESWRGNLSRVVAGSW